MTRPEARLVLLDIDGTILHGGRLWAESFMEAYVEICAAAVVRKVSFSGKTDRQICRELMEASGIWAPGENGQAGVDHNDPRIDRIIRGYLAKAREGLRTRAHEVRVLPGVRELIEALRAQPEVTLGLLTGNVREGAELKLASVGLGGIFEFGVFGDDHWNRYELPGIALTRAREALGLEVGGKQVVIVGDTIHDVGCGQSIGARAIGVGTGHRESRERVWAAWSGQALEAGDPRADHYFEDLADTQAVLRAILG